MSGLGLRLRLERGADEPATLRVAVAEQALGTLSRASAELPCGVVLEFEAADAPLSLPPGQAELTVTRSAGGGWGEGRAGMLYRDLIPNREGGRFIASHIRIPDGGPVPDYVHYHQVRFQMIFCVAGWVKVVYEDQGPPFVMHAGDCVLQPPEIRHRVLESSPGLEVLELGCPAEHLTSIDHGLELPTAFPSPERMFGGQRFVRSQAELACWSPWRVPGFACRDLGIRAATDGLARVSVIRPDGLTDDGEWWEHDGEFEFIFVWRGTTCIQFRGGATHALARGDAVTIPAGVAFRLVPDTSDFAAVEVSLPG